jgi:hypothetical protein
VNATPATPPRYRKLPGRAAGVASYTTLYVGPDHLLQVYSTGYSETYKRFYFRNIHAVALARTGAGSTIAIVAGVLTGLSLLLTIFLSLPGGNVGGAVSFGIVTVIFTAVLLFNLALGPTCRCRIHTAVQTERLPSLNRVRRALKVIRQIQPLIEAAQASLGPSLQAQPDSSVEPSPASAVFENPSPASLPVAEASSETPLV